MRVCLHDCVAQSVKERTSDLDVTGSRPPIATRHTSVRRVLLSSIESTFVSIDLFK